jgi:hypothetical protein
MISAGAETACYVAGAAYAFDNTVKSVEITLETSKNRRLRGVRSIQSLGLSTKRHPNSKSDPRANCESCMKFDWGMSSENRAKEAKFHTHAIKRLEALGGALGLTPNLFTIRPNVRDGTITLQSNWLFVEVSQNLNWSKIDPRCHRLNFETMTASLAIRSCRKRKTIDATTHYGPLELLDDPKIFVRFLGQLKLYGPDGIPTAIKAPTVSPAD